VTYFIANDDRSVKWWTRRESNPRPK